MKQQLQEATSVQRTAEMQASSLRHQLDEVKGCVWVEFALLTTPAVDSGGH